MRLFFAVLLLISGNCLSAVTKLTAISDLPGEIGTVTFTFSSSGVTQERNTNAISHKDELWFGKTKINHSPVVKSIRSELDVVFEKLKTVDKFFQDETGEGRNKFLEAHAHSLRFSVNDQVVLPDSRAFKEVLPLFEKLDALNWDLDRGIKVSKDATVTPVGSSKKISPISCEQKDTVRVCKTSGYGPIILE